MDVIRIFDGILLAMAGLIYGVTPIANYISGAGFMIVFGAWCIINSIVEVE